MLSISFTDMKGDIWAFTAVNSDATTINKNLLIIFYSNSLQLLSQKRFSENLKILKKVKKTLFEWVGSGDSV